MKYVFYDLETTGRSPYWDQIIQVAAIYTDEKLNVLDKLNYTCKLNSWCIPDPEALIVNKIPINKICNSNISNYQLMLNLYEKFSHWAPATFIGYNSISFDEEILRNSFFRNLLDPYLTIKKSNSRSDLLNLSRISNFFYPELLKSEVSEKGNPILKLESIAKVNGVNNFTAHDALGDTYATLELAKIIKKELPDLWIKGTESLDKTSLGNSITSKPFCYLESYFGKTKAFCLSYVVDHPVYNWALCFDLRDNPEKILTMNSEEVSLYLDKSPKIIRNIKLNKSPIFLDIKLKKLIDSYDEQSLDLLHKRHKFIRENKEFKDKILYYFNKKAHFNDTDISQEDLYAEETIYKKFIKKDDEILFSNFHKSKWIEKKNLIKKFKDYRLSYFANLLFYEEQPDLLARDTYNEIKQSLADKLLSKNKEKWMTVYEAYKKIDDLREKYANNNDDIYIKILNDINIYIENLENKLQ